MQLRASSKAVHLRSTGFQQAPSPFNGGKSFPTSSLFNIVLGEPDTHLQKDTFGPLPHNIHKIQFKMGQRHTCKS